MQVQQGQHETWAAAEWFAAMINPMIRIVKLSDCVSTAVTRLCETFTASRHETLCLAKLILISPAPAREHNNLETRHPKR